MRRLVALTALLTLAAGTALFAQDAKTRTYTMVVTGAV